MDKSTPHQAKDSSYNPEPSNSMALVSSDTDYDSTDQAICLTITGQVQGVGFRPFVYRLADDNKLVGTVKNSSQGVIIEIQGRSDSIFQFKDQLINQLPPLAEITSLKEESIPFDHERSSFEIIISSREDGHNVLISPDICICQDCLDDLGDPQNRRYLYPFTNCTNCGPRFTITKSIPYDRPHTSMACFPLCPSCQQEYENPLDRRFHAQPNACPDCGPQVWFTDSQNDCLAKTDQALEKTVAALSQGLIVAIKGLGGFHLACQATDNKVIKRLRHSKNRLDKPLAIMVPDIETADNIAYISEEERTWLEGRIRPILLLKKKPDISIPDEIAPDTNLIGVMLPYTPLHWLILQRYKDLLGYKRPNQPAALVMTSGNNSSEPIILSNREALTRLGRIADRFLLHNRDILVRCDDSVLHILPNSQTSLYYRRARGLTPRPVFLKQSGPAILGLGAETKTTICLTKKDHAFVSQHIGDLKDSETFDFYRQTIFHFQDILQTKPEAVVADLHPSYLSSQQAQTFQLPVFYLQHHFAHIHAVLAEHKHDGPVIGLALDGTGYGEDHTLWGGEFLYVHPEKNDHQRLGHLSPVLLPGGETAINEPWRTAQSYLFQLGVSEEKIQRQSWWSSDEQTPDFIQKMLEKSSHCIQTTSCGRLFDAVAALLGLVRIINYEGQGAILLEKIQDPFETSWYPCHTYCQNGYLNLDTLNLFAAVYEDWQNGQDPGKISRRFHLGLCHGLVSLTSQLAEAKGVFDIALSGGVFQNTTISDYLPQLLTKSGLKPLVHTSTPPNDACISLGQAVYGQRLIHLES